MHFIPRGELKGICNLTLKGLRQTPGGFGCWRRCLCLIRALLPGGFLAFPLEASAGPLAPSSMGNFKSHHHGAVMQNKAVLTEEHDGPVSTEGHKTLQLRSRSMSSPHAGPETIKDTASGPDKSS